MNGRISPKEENELTGLSFPRPARLPSPVFVPPLFSATLFGTPQRPKAVNPSSIEKSQRGGDVPLASSRQYK